MGRKVIIIDGDGLIDEVYDLDDDQEVQITDTAGEVEGRK